jgi:hypothetical protein
VAQRLEGNLRRKENEETESKLTRQKRMCALEREAEIEEARFPHAETLQAPEHPHSAASEGRVDARTEAVPELMRETATLVWDEA